MRDLRFANFRYALVSGLLLATIVTGCNSPQPPQPSVLVSGNSQVRVGSTDTFTATVINLKNQAVVWSVNGIPGGNDTIGTISNTGVYTPPSLIPTNNVVTVSAASVAAPEASGLAQVSILNPIPAVTGASVALESGTTYLINVTGSEFVNGAQIQANGSTLTTTFVSSNQLLATASIPSVSTNVTVDVMNPDPGAIASSPVSVPVYLATVAAASRLLDQATFGPTLSDIQQVQTIGLDAWITQQFNTPDTPLAQCTTAADAGICEESEWWQTALTGPDQLRQRVAFALSELFVISSDSVNPETIPPYHNMLAQDAFTNFYTIMNDVTLSPGMGAYLNMLNSAKAPAGQIANENYARELMQLFTIGLDELNDDGSLQLDSNGNPIPTYTQDQVQAFARAYTGWTYATASGGAPSQYPNGTPNYLVPMVAVESAHDTSAKTLLGGTVLPAGQTAEEDLQGALTNVFNEPNVGPFVCRQLIQHLVSGSPSPDYVARIAAVFNDNGNGVRGDMQAVLRAILEDPEARAGDTNPTYDGGHLREPILWITNFLRAVGFTTTSGSSDYLSYLSNLLEERPYQPASVFSFFPPSYVIPQTSLNAPEFGIENTATAILRLNIADAFVMNNLVGINVNLGSSSTLGQVAASGPGNLVDTLGEMFMHGQMPAPMRSEIMSDIASLDTEQQVLVATYLVITSSEYKVMH